MSKLDTNLLDVCITAEELSECYTGVSESEYMNDLQWRNPSNILGYPNVFNQYADARVANGRFGRMEFNTILQDAPLVFIQPGIPNYLDRSTLKELLGWGQSDSELIMDAMASGDETKVRAAIADVQSKGVKYDSRYYGFKPTYSSYIKFVNSMASYVILRMNLTTKMGDNNELASVKLASLNSGGTPFSKTMIPIYADAASTSFSEGSQNATAESMAAGFLKSSSQLVREAQFLFDGKVPIASDLLSSNLSDYSADVQELAGSGFTGNMDGFLNKIKGATSSVLKGGMVMFPEIWNDSQYRKTYDIGIKLWSPYGDKLSIYNNIIFPLICLLALSLPRQIAQTSYASPFLVKVYSKGWFSCDLGMVESITINKGENKSWSKDSLPLEVDVKLTIKDMYPTLSMAIGKYSMLTGFNSPLTEFLDTLSGIGVGEVDYLAGLNRIFDGSYLAVMSKAYELVAKWEQGFIDNVLDHAQGILGDLFDLFGFDDKMGDFFTSEFIDGVLGDIFTYDKDDASSGEDSTPSTPTDGELESVDTEETPEGGTSDDDLGGIITFSRQENKTRSRDRDKVISKKYNIKRI